MFCEKKKSKCPNEKKEKKKIQSVKRGRMFKYRISGVRKKKEIERKVPGKNVLGGNFAKFVFTGWALC